MRFHCALSRAKPTFNVLRRVGHILLRRFIPAVIISVITHQALAEELEWRAWLRSQVDQHPDIISARETLNAALSTAESRDRPLYNPEFETELEREGDASNYLFGINQTFDWRNKRGQRQIQSSYNRIAAQQRYEFASQEKAFEILLTLVDWQSATQQSVLALRQESQLDTLLAVIEGRLAAGDLGQIDAELAFLSLSQKLNDTAQAQVTLRQVEARLVELIPSWPTAQAEIPLIFWRNTEPKAPAVRGLDSGVDNHPSVVVAKAEWQVSQQEAELIRLETKPDPKFGINAGRSDGESIVALTFSIPLNVRNNFKAEARAANQEALAAEANYRAIRRRQASKVRASLAASNEYQKRLERWQGLMKGRGESSNDLLEKQWQSGDLSTTEYLLALQQRTEGLIAGIELRTQFETARIDWLLQTGEIKNALTN